MTLSDDAATCLCGHPLAAHRHYRPGTECAHCECPRFRARRWWSRLLDRAPRE